MADSKRQQKISKLLKKDLSEILIKNFRDRFDGHLLTVSHIKITPDLSHASIYFSILPNHQAEKVIEKLNSMTSEMRGLLGRKIGKTVRIVPSLAFYYDNFHEESQKIDLLFKNIEIPPENEN